MDIPDKETDGRFVMRPESWVVVVVRFFSVLLVLFGFYFVSMGMLRQSPLPVVVVALPLFLIAGLIGWFPNLAAHKLYPARAEGDSEPKASTDVMFDLGFVLLGLFVLVYAVSDLLAWIARFFLASFSAYDWALIGITVVEMALGLGLIIGRRRLRRVVCWMRYAT